MDALCGKAAMDDRHGRREAFASSSTAIADLGDDELRAALATGSARSGWGTSEAAEIAGVQVFV